MRADVTDAFDAGKIRFWHIKAQSDLIFVLGLLPCRFSKLPKTELEPP